MSLAESRQCESDPGADDNRDIVVMFVGGVPRSGTTLVQNILDSHPDVFGGPEFDKVPSIMRLREELHQAIDRGRIDVYCSKNDADQAIRRLVGDLLLPVARKHGASHLSEKTPTNVTVATQILELMPDARFVHIVRDPRAVVFSLQNVALRAKAHGKPAAGYTRSVLSAIGLISNWLACGFEAASRYPERTLHLRYEDLVQLPEDTCRRLCDFLGLKWTPDMLRPADVQHTGEQAIQGIWYDKAMYYRNPDARELDNWRTGLHPIKQAIVTLYFRDNAYYRQLGYSLSADHLTRSSRWTGWLLLSSFEMLLAILRWLQRSRLLRTVYKRCQAMLRAAEASAPRQAARVAKP